MKILLLDADGVFVDFVKGFFQVIKTVTGKEFTQDQITGFDIGQSLGLTSDEMEAVHSQIKPGFCRALEPIPDAIRWIQRINATCAEVYVVTSPLSSVPTWTHEREAWIKEHLGLHHSHVLHGSAKHLVRGDFFVDDKAETVEKWNLHNLGTAVMWKRPWNERYPWHGHRFNEWNKLEAVIQGQPYDA
jgi:5'(3')-deoxyribonucleotidase